jgi:hypothetical protein
MNELNSCVFRCITSLVELLGILKSNLYKSNPTKKERERENRGLTSSNLSLRNRLHPRKHEIHRDHHDTNDPKRLPVIGLVIPEDDGVDDAAEVSCCADGAGEDT